MYAGYLFFSIMDFIRKKKRIKFLSKGYYLERQLNKNENLSRKIFFTTILIY